MHQIISDAARIREMDTIELEEYFNAYTSEWENFWWWFSDPICNLINKQYLQLTNKKLF